MIRIRPAIYADSSDLARIQVDSYRSAYTGILPDEFLQRFDYAEQTQDWRDLLVSDQDFILLIAETDEGSIVGYALGHAGQSQISGYNSELDALHIRRDQQRQGTGRALIAAMAAELQQDGADSMMLWVLVQKDRKSVV